ncbi:MAG: hypothetical protein NTV34_16215 [Proteobacteria bacterium]|nr:hypothetical protein [Pseudomonadota bacterium]
MLTKFRNCQTSIRFYQLCKPLQLPPHARNQLLRASSSLGTNVLGGYGPISPKYKRKFSGLHWDLSVNAVLGLTPGRTPSPLRRWRTGELGYMNLMEFK